MTDWMIWFALAGILVAAEIFTGTFYLLMLAVGFAVGGIAAVADFPDYVQFIAAGATGCAVTLALYIFRHRHKKQRGSVQSNPAVLMDIGQTVEIRQWDNPHDGIYRTRVSYRGAWWDAELMPSGKPETGLFVINEIRGATLLVKNAQV